MPAVLITLALVAGTVAVADSARADSAPADPKNAATPTTVTADPLPTPQIDGVVWTELVVGNTVYVGGKFANARPAGAAAGTHTVKRTSMLAFDIRTGALNTRFAPVLNGDVQAISTAADGKHLYIGGSFTKVGSAAKSRIAEIDATTGALTPAFKASANGTVKSIVRRGSTVYFGGSFTWSTGKTRQQLAAVNGTTGGLSTWTPSATGGVVNALALSPDGKKVVVGGAFTTLDKSANPGYGLGAVDSASGKNLPWHVNSVVRNGGKNSAITSLTSTSTGLYGTGYTFGDGGNLEGAFRADWTAGDLTWVEDCHGDTYGSAVVGGVVYIAGHAHYCGNVGGFRETSPESHHRAIAFSATATQKVATNTASGHAYANFGGRPAPSLLDWYPDLTPGTFTGKGQAAWTVAGTSQYVVYGGEFTAVNGKAQQGLVRFATPSLAPNRVGPVSSGAAFVPQLTSPASGVVRVGWTSNADPDNKALRYDVYRDGDPTPVYTTTRNSSVWFRPQIGFTDAGLVPGHSYAYRVRATDPFGNTVLGDNVSITVASAGPTGYAAVVTGQGASNFWRFGQSKGSAVQDLAGYTPQILTGYPTAGAAGSSVDGSTATQFSASATTTAATATPSWPSVSTMSVGAWFRAAPGHGGTVVDFGSNSPLLSDTVDRSLAVTANGLLAFGIRSAGSPVLSSPRSVADSRWHFATATVTPTTMTLYLDGRAVARRSGSFALSRTWGYWRVGGDTPWLGAHYFTGTIDDVSVYPAALTDAQVAAQYRAATGT
ncbi:LamG-like jellyroll fold domain-containing protein [Frondihabitans peucedani]|uniref:Fibronectin type-III domain-containing protein n=1 Tax=Frondihabitans peucedani TaxID=598626 RepID=A0ABP8E616_9MICO